MYWHISIATTKVQRASVLSVIVKKPRPAHPGRVFRLSIYKKAREEEGPLEWPS